MNISLSQWPGTFILAILYWLTEPTDPSSHWLSPFLPILPLVIMSGVNLLTSYFIVLAGRHGFRKSGRFRHVVLGGVAGILLYQLIIIITYLIQGASTDGAAFFLHSVDWIWLCVALMTVGEILGSYLSHRKKSRSQGT